MRLSLECPVEVGLPLYDDRSRLRRLAVELGLDLVEPGQELVVIAVPVRVVDLRPRQVEDREDDPHAAGGEPGKVHPPARFEARVVEELRDDQEEERADLGEHARLLADADDVFERERRRRGPALAVGKVLLHLLIARQEVHRVVAVEVGDGRGVRCFLRRGHARQPKPAAC